MKVIATIRATARKEADATFIDRIAGSTSSFVKISYLLRYRDADHAYVARHETVYYRVANCGVVWW